MRASDRADVWVLLGPHKGDNDQVLALAHGLGVHFRAIPMRYRWFAHLPAVCRSVSIAQLQPESSREIAPPWPSLVLGIGQRSAPVARHIQRASGGGAKIVRLGDPMVSPRLFDLVITTPQYAVGEADNVIRLPVTITNPEEIRPNEIEEVWLRSFARPRRLMVIGGKTSLWRLDSDVVATAAQALLRRAELEGGSVIAVTSPRSSPELVSAAQAVLGDQAVVTGRLPRYRALLYGADEVHVTGDSVSMLSDAVGSGKPVGLIPLEPNGIAKFVRSAGNLRGQPFRLRRLENFWDDLRTRGLVGTIERPRAGSLDVAPINAAVEAVRAVLREPPLEPVLQPNVRPMAEPAAL